MAAQKNQPIPAQVTEFLDAVTDEQKRKDCYTLLQWMKDITGEAPEIWGGSIVGFGRYHYKYASGHEGDWFLTGFSPRKQNLTLYVMQTEEGRPDELLQQLGKYKTGKGCLYIKQLSDIDEAVLKKWLQQSVKQLRQK